MTHLLCFRVEYRVERLGAAGDKTVAGDDRVAEDLRERALPRLDALTDELVHITRRAY